MPDDPDKGLDDRLANIERSLKRLKAGLGLLGVKPCSWCSTFYQSSHAESLFDDCGELVCLNCVQQWWLHRSPKLSTHDREKPEAAQKHWLIAYHQGEVIRRLDDLPAPEQLLVKLVTGCEQCNASGKTYSGKRCHSCDARGTIWVVVRAPADRVIP